MLNNILDWLLVIDRYCFLLINRVFTNSFFDTIFPFLRIPAFWIPLYIFLFIYVILNFKKRSAIFFVLYFLIVVGFCDLISSHIVKQLIYRMRPCFDPDINYIVRHLTSYCSSTSSFTSSHAANHFGMGVFLFLTLKDNFKKYRYLFLLWAFMVSYAQVYVGVHYPLDIVCGGIIGALIGWRIAILYLKNYYQLIIKHE